VAEIGIERERHGREYTWVLGLVLLVVIVLGALSAASHRRQTAAAPIHRTGAEAADTDTQWDNIPPKLRQHA
jgi:hypothetical protein